MTTVTWSDPMVSDNMDSAPDFTCDRESGSAFPVGQTTQVECTATDHAMNTATCTFSVTVGTHIRFSLDNS